MKNLLFIFLLLIVCNSGYSQMTLAYSYPQYHAQIAPVKLSLSGKKIAVMRGQNGLSTVGDTLFFYNQDYSFWKMIPMPVISGYIGQYNFHREVGTAVGVFYPSETLFNTDTLLEVAVCYRISATSLCNIYVINEQGTLTDSIINVYMGAISNFKVSGDSIGNYKAYVTMDNGEGRVYNLPGSLPCESCISYSFVNVDNKEKRKMIQSLPMPNPSRDELKIKFILPSGIQLGTLNVYDGNGRLVKTCQVDNKFGYITLDNTSLPAGTYVYNIVSDGVISSTQKFVVIK